MSYTSEDVCFRHDSIGRCVMHRPGDGPRRGLSQCHDALSGVGRVSPAAEPGRPRTT